jgi:Zn-dependent protease with chaperone function
MTSSVTPNAPATCPVCKTALPTDPRYATWCPACEWNLRPSPSQPENKLRSAYDRAGQRAGEALLAEMIRHGKPSHNLTCSKLTAFALAGLVHCSTLVLAATGISLVAFKTFRFMNLFLAVICLGFAWLLRPRLPKLPKSHLSEQDFPALYQRTNRIAAELGYKRIRIISVNEDFNASFYEAGWRRQPVVTLGLPLLLVLASEERIALIAHEVAHGVNHDPLRTLVVGSAANALFYWHKLLKPDRLTEEPTFDSLGGLIEILITPIFRFLMFLLSLFPWSLGLLLLHLIWRDSQRAEYLAELLAARVAGTQAAISSREKSYYQDAYAFVAEKYSRTHQPKGFFEMLGEEVNLIPASELERIRRLDVLSGNRWDNTHPPMAFIINLLRAQASSPPRIILSSAESDQLNAELESLKPEIEAQLKERFLSGICY